jgi:hypothetical protein
MDAQANAATQPRNQGDRCAERSEDGGDVISTEEIKLEARRSSGKAAGGCKAGKPTASRTLLGRLAADDKFSMQMHGEFAVGGKRFVGGIRRRRRDGAWGGREVCGS